MNNYHNAQANKLSHSLIYPGNACGGLSGLLLWFAWLRTGRVNRLAATALGLATLGVVAMDRRLARSVQERVPKRVTKTYGLVIKGSEGLSVLTFDAPEGLPEEEKSELLKRFIHDGGKLANAGDTTQEVVNQIRGHLEKKLPEFRENTGPGSDGLSNDDSDARDR